jgi:hypothetical protein
MRGNIIHSSVLAMLFTVASCAVGVDSIDTELEASSEQAVSDNESGESSMRGGLSGAEFTDGQLGLNEKESLVSCGALVYNYRHSNGWTQYAIYNCHPQHMSARVIRQDGSRGPCHVAIPPGYTVWAWIFGSVIGIEGC